MLQDLHVQLADQPVGAGKGLLRQRAGRQQIITLRLQCCAPVRDLRRTLTPQLRSDCGATSLLLVDLGRGRDRKSANP